ncbi:MAG: hypothetical protein A2Y16_07155 [Tenericutes bacterium GWF2_57_13]|nr:MAG: hypothetical protein A2Y16_07155 [Tenericutes bacterium GWF2_57_13]
MDRIFDFLKRTFRVTPVTADLVVINAIMFIVTLSIGGFTNANLIRLGGLVPAYVTQNGEWYRVLTAMFLHGSILHFVMNMIALYYLGSAMERAIGPVRFLGLYLVAGIGADLAIAFFDTDLTIGASGALYGIMAALFYITLAHKNWFTPASVGAIQRMILINFAITFLIPNISVIGHLAGFALGFLAAVALVPKIPFFARRNPSKPQNGEDQDDDGEIPPA